MLKDKFKNVSPGVLGVIQVDARGNQVGGAVKPDDSVWLSETEQVLTANAPREEKDNPLSNGSLELEIAGENITSARPLRPEEGTEAPQAAEPPPTGPGLPQPLEETGAPVAPQGEPEEGQLAPGEEVGTPEAPAKARATATKPQTVVRGDPRESAAA